MTAPKGRSQRILSLCVQGNGIGWSVLETPYDILNWGLLAKPDEKLNQGLTRILTRYEPTLIAIERHSQHDTKKGPRALRQMKLIANIAAERRIPVRYIFRSDIRSWLGVPKSATKYEIASALVNRIAEFEYLLPPKRKIWKNEDSKLLILMSLALSFTAA